MSGILDCNRAVGDKERNNIEGILLALHKSPRGLPSFAVTDLSTLPPLDVSNIDFGHILSEFRAMREEIAAA